MEAKQVPEKKKKRTQGKKEANGENEVNGAKERERQKEGRSEVEKEKENEGDLVSFKKPQSGNKQDVKSGLSQSQSAARRWRMKQQMKRSE